MLQSVTGREGCMGKPARITGACLARHAEAVVSAGDESAAALERRVAELLLVAEFTAVVGSILDPHKVCEAAGTWLREAVGWQLLSVCCNGEAVGAGRGSKNRRSVAAVPLYVAPGVNGLSEAGDVYPVPFPDGSGTISLCRQAVRESQYSDEFREGIVRSLARALANARECDRLKTLSMRDHLTGLYNRRVFEAMLEVETRKRTAKPFSLLLIDLDNFKLVNDTYGHGTGDQVLVAIARMLRLSFRKSDIVSRYGGEEFAVLLPETAPDSARQVAERFRENVASLSLGAGPDKIRPTVSVGIASIAYRFGIEVADVMEEADRALYRAKAAGKDRVCASLLGDRGELSRP